MGLLKKILGENGEQKKSDSENIKQQTERHELIEQKRKEIKQLSIRMKNENFIFLRIIRNKKCSKIKMAVKKSFIIKINIDSTQEYSFIELVYLISK